MAITINSADLYNESATSLPNTGIVVEYSYQPFSISLSVKLQLTFYNSTFARDNNFQPIKRLLFSSSPPAFTEINKIRSESLTQGTFDAVTPSNVETYIKTYIEGVLGVNTVTIS